MGVGEIQRRREGGETGRFHALGPEKEGKWRLCYVIPRQGLEPGQRPQAVYPLTTSIWPPSSCPSTQAHTVRSELEEGSKTRTEPVARLGPPSLVQKGRSEPTSPQKSGENAGAAQEQGHLA